VSSTIELMENGTALVVSLGDDFDFATEGEAQFAQITSILDRQTEPIFYMVDLRKLDITFDETLALINRVARGEDALLRHPNIREIIYVISNTFQRAVAEGLDSEWFGNLKVKLVYSLDEGLDYIRSQQGR
jgi:hypothetical protein